MFIPFFTSFQVAFPTQFPRNYSCNIIVPSLALLLCQLFTFAHNMSYCFTFLVTHSTKWWFGLFIYLVFHIVCSNCLLRSTQHGFFQLSSQLFSASSMLLFHLLFLAFLLQTPCILLFFHRSFFSLIQLCLNPSLFKVSLYSIVSAAFTPSINGSTQFPTYHPKLFSSILVHPSQLINPLPPTPLLRYALPTSLLGCSGP